MFRRHTFLMCLNSSKTRRNVCFYSCMSWRWLFIIQAKRGAFLDPTRRDTKLNRWGKESGERKQA